MDAANEPCMYILLSARNRNHSLALVLFVHTVQFLSLSGCTSLSVMSLEIQYSPVKVAIFVVYFQRGIERHSWAPFVFTIMYSILPAPPLHML